MKLVELSSAINRDYAGREVVIICNLKGAFMVTADMVRLLKIPVRIDFVSFNSYKGTESTGRVTGSLDLTEDIAGKPVILVEDIVDTGLTVTTVSQELAKLNPSEIKIFSLLYREGKYEPDYAGFAIKDGFVCGYGLDLDGSYRELRDVWRIEP